MKAFKLKETWLAIALAFGAGYVIAYFLSNKTEAIAEQQEENHSTQLREKGRFTFINPLIECDNYLPENSASIANLKWDIKNYIAEATASGVTDHVSVYYRDLNNGGWVGINESERFSPASLLKVPIMIAALKKAETTPDLLQKKIKFTQYIDDTTPNIVDTGLVRLGQSYTFEDLIFKMIAHSDNEAKNLILEEIGMEAFDQSFVDAGIALPDFDASSDILSTRSYSSFFRILYNATYLSKEMSEKALSILSMTNFGDGIVAGIPSNILCANKFGERGFADSDVKQLHDCGIVYVNENPYLLCIMTRGTEFDKLKKVIAKISAIVYSDVSGTK